VKLLVHRVVWAFLPALPYAPFGATIVENRSCDLRSVCVRLDRDFDFTATECIRCAEAGSHEELVVVWAFLPALPYAPLVRRVRVRLDRDFDFTATE